MSLAYRKGTYLLQRSTKQGTLLKWISSRPITFSSTHDYVICGAGSAGCVLANRLSADPNNNVLLLEAGPQDKTWKIHMPAAIPYNLCDDKYNWFYHTEPQKNLNDRIIYWPRGRVLGGSSSLNAMIYNRGHAYDYDRWESEGAKGWSYADCLPYFKKAQTHELGPNEYRGGSGPLHVSRGQTKIPLHQALIDSGRQAGYPVTEDFNGFQQEGFGLMDLVIHQGRRWNTSTAYLNPAKHRKNLRIETKAFVTRIVFEGDQAVGLEYHVDNQVRRARASKEVILSGGSVNSPQLLMLSGVGDSEELNKHGIPVVCHLPGVGQNLQDHPQIYIEQECIQSVGLHKYQKWWTKILIGAQWFLTKKGPCGTSHFDTGAFIRSDNNVSHPDIQFDFVPIVLRNEGGKMVSKGHGYRTSISLQRSASTGYITLKSRDPRDHPVIQPNYLETEYDWELTRKGLSIGRHVLSQNAFKPFRGKEIIPGDHVQTDEDIDDFIRTNLTTNYHPSCTCKMGDPSDPLAVVDPETRVIGIKGVRVVDASVMPSIVSGNLNAPTIMIAEKAADHILGNEMLPKSNAPVFSSG
ncbi:choline dehydrogenase, mitochondrial-like [Actinia tenebrosa]|uniref:Choline dehydrogenase, mitochondrial-like n=1 Tax=Actinia tenebrosa TaxID=6105 RepID=A0A6P8J3C1_ACTTE|nr:choline dehydrogenase, mitochondrial-like [Actinia tenebrosa]